MKNSLPLCLAVTMIFSSATSLAKKIESNPQTIIQENKQPKSLKIHTKILFSGNWSYVAGKVQLNSSLKSKSTFSPNDDKRISAWTGKISQILTQLNQYNFNSDSVLATSNAAKAIQDYYKSVLTEMQGDKGTPLILTRSKNIFTSYRKTFVMPQGLYEKINKAYGIAAANRKLNIDVIIGGRRDPKAFVMITPGDTSIVAAMGQISQSAASLPGTIITFPRETAKTSFLSAFINSAKKLIGKSPSQIYPKIDMRNVANQMLSGGSTSAVMMPYRTQAEKEFNVGVIVRPFASSSFDVTTIRPPASRVGLSQAPEKRVIYAGKWSLGADNKIHLQSPLSPFNSQNDARLFASWMKKITSLLKEVSHLDGNSDPLYHSLQLPEYAGQRDQSVYFSAPCEDCPDGIGKWPIRFKDMIQFTIDGMRMKPLTSISLASSGNIFTLYERAYQMEGGLCNRVNRAYNTDSHCLVNVGVIIGGQPDPKAFIMIVPGDMGAIKFIDQTSPPNTIPGTLFTLPAPRIEFSNANISSRFSQFTGTSSQDNTVLPQPPGGGIADKAKKDIEKATGTTGSATPTPPPPDPVINIRAIAMYMREGSARRVSVMYSFGAGGSSSADYPGDIISDEQWAAMTEQAIANGGTLVPADRETACGMGGCEGASTVERGGETLIYPTGTGGLPSTSTQAPTVQPSSPATSSEELPNGDTRYTSQSTGAVIERSPDGRFETITELNGTSRTYEKNSDGSITVTRYDADHNVISQERRGGPTEQEASDRMGMTNPTCSDNTCTGKIEGDPYTVTKEGTNITTINSGGDKMGADSSDDGTGNAVPGLEGASLPSTTEGLDSVESPTTPDPASSFDPDSAMDQFPDDSPPPAGGGCADDPENC